MYHFLITADELHPHLNDMNWVIIDCRYSLQEPEKGRQRYEQNHIPGAFYAHLDEDLSDPVVPGKTGRHPLPSIEKLVHLFSCWGINKDKQVVVYDFKSGSIAARLWWLLRWLGHEHVAVLDGGWAAWEEGGYPTDDFTTRCTGTTFVPRIQSDLAVNADFVEEVSQQTNWKVVDSRAPERYRGEEEPIDPVAGHIPGAVNLHFMENVDEEGRFLHKQKLKKRFESALGDIPADHTIFYCGSGVTACHNILAYKIAGLGDAKLYPGSWSEWITRD